jgi:hypothetical protein
MRMTPWGTSDSETEVVKGIIWCNTPSHEGFLVGKAVAKKLLTPAAQAVGRPFAQYLAYEGDCDAAIVMLELHATRDGFWNVTDECLIESLSHWHPEYLAARGIAPTAEAFVMPASI